MRVLLVGSGGREHALAWKLAQSPRLTELHAVPGNPGIGRLAALHAVPLTDLEGITQVAADLAPDLVVVGPEAPLAAGLADRITEAGIPCFGPTRGRGPARELEGVRQDGHADRGRADRTGNGVRHRAGRPGCDRRVAAAGS